MLVRFRPDLATPRAVGEAILATIAARGPGTCLIALSVVQPLEPVSVRDWFRQFVDEEREALACVALESSLIPGEDRGNFPGLLGRQSAVVLAGYGEIRPAPGGDETCELVFCLNEEGQDLLDSLSN